MDIKTSWVDLAGENGRMAVYVAEPAAPGRYPALMYCHAVVGMTPGHRAMVDRIAADGYVVAMADLYHRSGYRQQFAWPDEREKAFATRATTSYFTWAQDSRVTLNYLRGLPNVDGDRLGTIGHCFGGAVALVAGAMNRDVRAVCCMYPTGLVNTPMTLGTPVSLIGLVPQIQGQLFVMSGNGDENPSPADVRALAAVMERYGKKLEYHIWEGDPPAGHAFFEADIPMFYHQQATEWGWPIKLDFLRRALNG